MTCPNCRGAVLVHVAVALAGSRFTMHSCPACEQRWWDRDGQPVGLDGVLSTASAR